MRPIPLPTEVLEAIVDLNKYDRRTLAACGAAGKKLLVRSRVHLFSEVHLYSPRASLRPNTRSQKNLTPSISTRCDLLWAILQDNPDLARHVKALMLSEAGRSDSATYWIAKSTTLVPVAQSVSHLCTFVLRVGPHSGWSPVLTQTMHLCIRAPSIESIELCGLRAPNAKSLFPILSTPHPGNTLLKLRLSDVHVPPGFIAFGALSEHHPFTVSSLDLAFSPVNGSLPSLFPLLRRGVPLIKLSHLRHLRITVDDELSTTMAFVKLCEASLVQLDLRFTHRSGVWDMPARDESVSLTNLSTLRFEISVYGSIGAILRILRLLTAPALTEVIFLTIQDPKKYDDRDAHDYRWGDLDSLLTKHRFPNFDSVRYEVEDSVVPADEG
ncbi:hypothetical protein B0H11DRAFT_2100269 [Mycena galericulata]|nr:hypothetical protein B0H11DRAFT_2100269 [Mycena galericulata]